MSIDRTHGKTVLACALAVIAATVAAALATPASAGTGAAAADKVRLAAADKVRLCHRTGNGNFVAISIARKALKAHLRHGDVQMQGAVTSCRLPVVTLQKICVGTMTGTFTVNVNRGTATLATRTLSCGQTASVTVRALTGAASGFPATLTIVEAPAAGFTTRYGGACSATGQLTITLGQNLTCEITNTAVAATQATVTVNKVCAAGVTGTFTLAVGSGAPVQVTCPLGAVTGTGAVSVALNAPVTVSETVVSGGVGSTATIICTSGTTVVAMNAAGTRTATIPATAVTAGATIVCTVTNTAGAAQAVCVHTKGYYANHASDIEAILLAHSVLGPGGRVLTAAQITAVLSATPATSGLTLMPKNAVLNLAQQLLTAELNIAAGAIAPASVRAAISQALAALTFTFRGNTLVAITASTTLDIDALIQILSAFNEGTMVGGPSACP
jgi:hypothetical protein